jgi:ParB/RepB/Spo0J family partition protein
MESITQPFEGTIVPSGELLKLPHKLLVPNPQNPRILFDPDPLQDLKENIRQHGVLVPLTVFLLPDKEKYGILDGARRHRCCQELQAEGLEFSIPCNVVAPPDVLAGMLYMFNIHNFREAWELMPTALSLKIVMESIDERDTKKLRNLTGLSEPQIERCKLLLTIDERFQRMSLDPNPKTRIPSNFWIEASPVVELVEENLPELFGAEQKSGILDRLVDKYRVKRIKSVLHFRRIVEAFECTAGQPQRESAVQSLHGYIMDRDIETRVAFDGFIQDSRKVRSAVQACDDLLSALAKAHIEHVTENRNDLIEKLKETQVYISGLLANLSGTDDPTALSNQEDDDEESDE